MLINEKITQLILLIDSKKKVVAEKASISTKTLENYETGKNPPTLKFILWLKEEFPNLNLNWFLANEEPKWIEEENYDRNELEELRKIVARHEKNINKLMSSFEQKED